MDDWVALYKLGRLGILAITLLAIAIYLFAPSRRSRLEEPARRMLENDR
jgi:hypothetical protein